MEKATLEASISVPEDVVFQDLDGEAVILSLEQGKYYGLDAVGTRMWRSLTEFGQVRPAYEALLAAYEVPEEQLRQDLLKLIDELADLGLLQIENSG